MNLRWLMALAFAGSWGVVLSGHAQTEFQTGPLPAQARQLVPSAAEASRAEPLRLQEAVARSLSEHPSLAAEAAQLLAVQARAEREALAPPLVVGGSFENAVGTGNLSGVRSAETTLRLSRVIELGGKRAARQALGEAQVAQQRNAAQATRIEVAGRTTTRFIEVLADQQRLAFAHERVTQAERTRREVAGWVAAARNPESDLRAAEIALAQAELEREHAEHELAAARVSLAASWGSFTPDFDAVAGELDALPAVEDFETLAARLTMTASQRDSLLQAQAISARRQVAVAGRSPDIDLSLGVRRLEAFDDQGLVMSVSVPLGSRPRANLAIAEADAELAAVIARRDAQRSESHQDLFERYQELLHARTEYVAVRDTMLPKAEQAYAFTRRGFEAGNFSFLMLAQAQRTLFELRERSVEAAARYHTRLVEIERLTVVAPETNP